jgi:hypothetical protein
MDRFKPLSAKLNYICHFLALLGAHHILHVSSLRVKVEDIKKFKCTAWKELKTLGVLEPVLVLGGRNLKVYTNAATQFFCKWKFRINGITYSCIALRQSEWEHDHYIHYAAITPICLFVSD